MEREPCLHTSNVVFYWNGILLYLRWIDRDLLRELCDRYSATRYLFYCCTLPSGDGFRLLLRYVGRDLSLVPEDVWPNDGQKTGIYTLLDLFCRGLPRVFPDALYRYCRFP